MFSIYKIKFFASGTLSQRFWCWYDKEIIEDTGDNEGYSK